MKIVATADLHGFFPAIEPCELLLIAGDICPIESDDYALRVHDNEAQTNWICTTFAEWCAEQPAEHIVWIAGNHDFGPELPDFEQRVKGKFPEHVHYLKDDIVVINGRTVYGSPWTPNLSNWAFYARDKAWHWIGEDIPAYTDILMLHSPPSGVMLDGGHPGWSSPFIITDITQRVRPELCVFGHIHEGYGEIEVKDIKFANVAYCDQYYDPVQPPKEWEL